GLRGRGRQHDRVAGLAVAVGRDGVGVADGGGRRSLGVEGDLLVGEGVADLDHRSGRASSEVLVDQARLGRDVAGAAGTAAVGAAATAAVPAAATAAAGRAAAGVPAPGAPGAEDAVLAAVVAAA